MEKKRRKAAEHREAPISYNPPNELFYYTQARQHGKCAAAVVRQELNTYLSLQIPGLLKEREYALGYINKIFAAQWLSDQQVVFGTKCNKVFQLDFFLPMIVRLTYCANGTLDTKFNHRETIFAVGTPWHIFYLNKGCLKDI